MSVDFEYYRKFFPITKTDIYLNHAAISPLSTKVTESVSKALQDRARGTIDTFQTMLSERSLLKQNLAQLINTTPETLAIIENTSDGFNWFVNSLEWKEGDRILLVEGEFPSNIYPFLNLERLGVNVDFVPTRKGMIYLEDIESEITPKTKLLSISFVEFFTGFRNDLNQIGKICKKNNILFSVDGIQGVGAIPIDVRKAQVDFLSNGGHKWLMGPMGCGFMYINPDIINDLNPVFAGWLSVKDSWNFLDYNLDFLDDAGRFEIGTANYLGIVGARASTDLLVEVKPDNTIKHLLKMGDILIEAFQEIGLTFVGSDKSVHRSGIYTFTGGKIDSLFEYLKQKRIHCSLRNNALRISPHYYNSPDDLNELIHQCTRFYKNRN